MSPGFPGYLRRQTLGLSFIPGLPIPCLRRNKKDQNTQNETVGRNATLPLFGGHSSWCVWGLVPAEPRKMRQEDGVELVSVLLVVSVTGGTSQTYVLLAGPEELD